MKTEKPFRWAFIGCGDIACITARELLQTGEGIIAAVWNRTRERADVFVKTYGGVVCDTAEEAIRREDVDGVYIAVTANLHEFYMRKCIEAGKPVLCEKPFTVNASQAASVLEYARQEQVYAAEAMWTWFNATANQVKYWVKSGVLGKIHRVYCTYSFPMIYNPRKKPRHTSPELIGGALLDTGVYGIRYCYELFGMPGAVHCEGRVVEGIDLGETIRLEYDGFQADFLFTRDQNHGETFEITGENGTITVPFFHCARKAELRGQVKGKIRDKRLLYGTMFAETAREIREGRRESDIISPESTVEVLQILDECRRRMGLVYPCEEEV